MLRCLRQAAVARPAGPAPTTTTGRGAFETAVAEGMPAIIASPAQPAGSPKLARAAVCWLEHEHEVPFPITVCYSPAFDTTSSRDRGRAPTTEKHWSNAQPPTLFTR